MDWAQHFISWYMYLFLLGMVFFPVTQRIFRHSIDGGYAFAKIIGLITLSYVMFVLGIFRLVPYTREAMLGLLAIVGVWSYRKYTDGKLLQRLEQYQARFWWILFEEMLFFIGLLVWSYVRAQEPSIHGLEKFMDYGFMQSIARSTYFPPLDMWYGPDTVRTAGYAINYYYFGHLSGATLIKLTDVPSAIGYNLVLANILGLSMSAVFSIVINLIHHAQKYATHFTYTSQLKLTMYGLLGAILVNLAGNAHTIYLFTKGYPNDAPVSPLNASIAPEWGKLALSVKDQFPDVIGGLQRYSNYWYPNATRFIPFTIHEFPSYSYIVADLHGHVYDIPFVLLTLGIIVICVIPLIAKRYFGQNLKDSLLHEVPAPTDRHMHGLGGQLAAYMQKYMRAHVPLTIGLGFMTAVHYMTNASDGPIYLLLSALILVIVHGFGMNLFVNLTFLVFSWWFFVRPFAQFFTPFVNGIGVNCGYGWVQKWAAGADTYKIGPFLFEKGNCQSSDLYQLLILWGFFWLHLFILVGVLWYSKRERKDRIVSASTIVTLLFFLVGSALIMAPEFVYIKDIYPGHFRANTMFKLGYQAYIMMSIASVYVMWRLRHLKEVHIGRVGRVISTMMIILVLMYMRVAVQAYYGIFDRQSNLDGSAWLKQSYPDILEVISYLNTDVKGQPTILEGQGDSYTDHNVISAYTGLPTVAGWWVHEWLWRGSPSIVGDRKPDIEKLYKSEDIDETRRLLRKYQISYVIVSDLERKLYETNEAKIPESKFLKLGTEVFRSSGGKAVVYKVR